MLKERERDGDPMLKFIKKKPKVIPTGKPKKGVWVNCTKCVLLCVVYTYIRIVQQ